MTFHSIERLLPPFHSVSEVGLVIPPLGKGETSVENGEFKLLFFLEANCLMSIDGTDTYSVNSGDILVMPRTGSQRYRVVEKRQLCRVHAVKITFLLPPLPPRHAPASRGRAIAGDPEQNLKSFVQHHFSETRHLPHAQNPAMREIMRGVRAEAEQYGTGIRHRVSALCTNLVVHVARSLHAPTLSASNAGTGYGSFVNQTKEFLLRNFSRELTLGEIAWHVRKSEEHLARVFQKATGQTIFDYLRTVRLENAKTMLIDSDKTLTEISSAAGFSSLALFSRNFSRYVGQNASTYRKNRSLTALWREQRTKTT
jgi:AraC-like DNA-binding protein